MDLLRTFGMDYGRCEDGVWIPFGDARLLIASAFSRRHQAAMNEMKRAIRMREEQKLPTLTDVELLELECSIYAETVLLGWDGVTEGIDDDGTPKPLDATVENRVRMLRGAPPFLIGVKGLAREIAPYSLARDEGALGNSERSSPGDLGGDRKTSNGSNDLQPAAP